VVRIVLGLMMPEGFGAQQRAFQAARPRRVHARIAERMIPPKATPARSTELRPMPVAAPKKDLLNSECLSCHAVAAQVAQKRRARSVMAICIPDKARSSQLVDVPVH
jgi:hypothetical protein